MSTIKVRNCKDLTDAEYIKKRWQEYMGKYREKTVFSMSGDERTGQLHVKE